MIKSTIKNEPQNQSQTVIKRKFWTKEEDNILRSTVKLHGSQWKIIAEYLNDRNASQCAQRWKRIKPETGKKRQKWDLKEDEKLRDFAQAYHCDWKTIARLLPHRTGRQIRERYINHLDPKITHRQWTPKEDQKIWNMYKRIGSRWSYMAKKLIGRPENMIKNRFYAYIRKTYANQLNPYYKFPEQKRYLQMEEEIVETSNMKEQIILIKQADELGLECFDPELLSLNPPIHSDRHILIRKNEQDSKRILEYNEKEFKLHEPFQHIFAFESNMSFQGYQDLMGTGNINEIFLNYDDRYLNKQIEKTTQLASKEKQNDD